MFKMPVLSVSIRLGRISLRQEHIIVGGQQNALVSHRYSINIRLASLVGLIDTDDSI